ncbi:unnamed protein product [Auanema sp. JU1783]|nr:unnamed protein product [Auanema sp. JU1783]
MKLLIQLHDHTGHVHDRLRYEFNNEDTIKQLQNKICSIWKIEQEHQQIFFDNGSELDAATKVTLQSVGLKDESKVIIVSSQTFIILITG